MLSYRLMDTSMKENNVFNYDDIETTRWDYWDYYDNDDEPRQSEVQLTSNEQTSSSSLILISRPMYSDRREREKEHGEQSRASSASRREATKDNLDNASLDLDYFGTARPI